MLGVSNTTIIIKHDYNNNQKKNIWLKIFWKKERIIELLVISKFSKTFRRRH